MKKFILQLVDSDGNVVAEKKVNLPITKDIKFEKITRTDKVISGYIIRNEDGSFHDGGLVECKENV